MSNCNHEGYDRRPVVFSLPPSNKPTYDMLTFNPMGNPAEFVQYCSNCYYIFNTNNRDFIPEYLPKELR